MANAAQGAVATWRTVSLGEVVSIDVDGIAADTIEVTPRNHAPRNKIYSAADVDVGAVSITCRGTAGMALGNVGLTGALSIVAPGVTWTHDKAIFETLGWSASVGELQTFRVTFKIGAA